MGYRDQAGTTPKAGGFAGSRQKSRNALRSVDE